MMRRISMILVISILFVLPASAAPIRWVDFSVPYSSLKYAMDTDIETYEKEKHLSWIDVLSVAACRTGGKCPLQSVKKAVKDLQSDASPEELLGNLYQYYAYYHESFSAVLGGLLGSYAIEVDGQWKPTYGLKAFSPVAAGYGYSHCDDFGVGRSFGFKRKHLGKLQSFDYPLIHIENNEQSPMPYDLFEQMILGAGGSGGIFYRKKRDLINYAPQWTKNG